MQPIQGVPRFDAAAGGGQNGGVIEPELHELDSLFHGGAVGFFNWRHIANTSFGRTFGDIVVDWAARLLVGKAGANAGQHLADLVQYIAESAVATAGTGASESAAVSEAENAKRILVIAAIFVIVIVVGVKTEAVVIHGFQRTVVELQKLCICGTL